MVEMVPVVLNGRWDLILPKHRADRIEWHALDGWEGARLLAMSERIGPGSVVYYVGAEEGDMCGLIASWGAAVAMFEPNPLVWPNIRAIWEANQLPAPLAAVPGFAGHETRAPAIHLGSWPDSATGPVIGDHGFCNLEERPDLPSVRLDDFAEATGTVPTDISIDVEGSEGRVIDGAEQLITAHHPRIWLSGHPEFMLQHWGDWTERHRGHPEYLGDLRRRLRDHGYQETLLGYDHEVHLMYEAIA
jgi:FkbM family methyltransferase